MFIGGFRFQSVQGWTATDLWAPIECLRPHASSQSPRTGPWKYRRRCGIAAFRKHQETSFHQVFRGNHHNMLCYGLWGLIFWCLKMLGGFVEGSLRHMAVVKTEMTTERKRTPSTFWEMPMSILVYRVVGFHLSSCRISAILGVQTRTFLKDP